jgi:CBS-domain-containing membrane protein
MKSSRIQTAILAGIGGAVGIFLLAVVSVNGGALLLMAPFGASCVLLFSVPSSPLSQPMNVVGGHLVSSAIGVLLSLFVTPTPMALGLSVALAIVFMALLNVTHPPAGADPLLIMLGAKEVDFLLFPVLTGSVSLVLIACAYHHFLGTAEYPLSKKTRY